jgi:polyhydroxyalkanoate synthesis regulator phasin
VPDSRKTALLLTLAALAAPLAACGDDARDQVDQARKDVREKANELSGNLDDLSKQDLRNALNDAEDAAKNGSADTKRKARELERKIERELNSRRD